MPDEASLLRRVRAYALRHELFRPGRVVVGVSGGADSLTLLHILTKLQSEFALSLHIATFDHGIRGESSAEDVRFVQHIATRGIPLALPIASRFQIWQEHARSALKRPPAKLATIFSAM